MHCIVVVHHAIPRMFREALTQDLYSNETSHLVANMLLLLL